MLTDPFGRPITYLRISLTDRCNLRCAYCLPAEGLDWLPRQELLTNEEIVRVAQTAARLGIHKLRLTGGEPLVRPGIVDLVRRLAAITGIQDVSLTTNGMLLEILARPLAQLNLEYPWHVRFIEVMPIGNQQDWGEGFPAPQARYVSVQEMRARLRGLNLQPAETPTGSGPARTLSIPGASGTVGFISPLGEHFCQNCNRLRLTADGKLRVYLVIPGEISLRSTVRTGQSLDQFFFQAVASKPRQHDLSIAAPATAGRGMSQIGG